MLGGGELKSSSLVQQMVWGGTGSISSGVMGSLRLQPCAEEQADAAASPASMLFLPQQLLHISSSSSSPGLNILDEVNCSSSTGLPLGSFHGDGQQEGGMAEYQSWRQLLLGGLVGDHERYSTATALLSKGLDDEGPMPHESAAYDFYGHGASSAAAGEEINKASPEASFKSQLSQMLLASSPRSCVTTSTGLGSSMMEFSNSAAAPVPELTRKQHHGQSDNSSECNSTETGSALKKARVQASSSAQSTLKVRKERLGDRITALHQIVSPFGKTDTASVLQETIGYIRFLLGQIEALSYPYLGHCCSGTPMQQQTGIMSGERSIGLLPEFPGQEAEKDDGDNNNNEAIKDLRSRGLCLVPVSCMPHLAADNDVVVGSDFWAAAGAPPLAGINLR
ncbi:transcription factor bHLH68-like isoform X2 [Oryza brachyantha]|uniref:BHLH domain-containing protein n=1 Tax=Oryza brachyantha TaxID=4533 RepID=J3KXZ0_ORYBR|nr:transcription factor bHLH68-like isoform X2 [Oryza brachyantha]